MLDDRTAARRELDDVHHFVWTNELNHFGWRAYLGAEPGSAEVPPYAVPARREDVRGLPPAWIGVGDIDLFHDEDVAHAARLRDAGVETTLEVVPRAPHGFETIPVGAPVSNRYNERADAWLADHLL
jgi:acetyl esterase/lipase